MTDLLRITEEGRRSELGNVVMAQNTFRVVTRAADGSLKIKDYSSAEAMLRTQTQVGVDDCSTDLSLRGLPVIRGLVGPMPEGKQIVRYESPEVFEAMTKEWILAKIPRQRRRRRTKTGSLRAAG